MSKADTQSSKNNLDNQSKSIKKSTDLKTIFLYLKNNIATATMVSEATGIPQKSICRYKRDLEKHGKLMEVEKRFCKITGFRAWYLTTNPNFFPKSNQLEMF